MSTAQGSKANISGQSKGSFHSSKKFLEVESGLNQNCLRFFKLSWRSLVAIPQRLLYLRGSVPRYRSEEAEKLLTCSMFNLES